ncbi:nodulation-signaling pathway 2 protein-like [Quillaja saponaria]|uniref:Nodulation-signaling pathway 2 protein-like n=1 Tax=Quillaja saponaria TaxID=32244 RepID=A0AAD7LFM0_QUISA|nr:nodulation-signaling pathway 2 protein-like [Quillaja saponaria]
MKAMEFEQIDHSLSLNPCHVYQLHELSWESIAFGTEDPFISPNTAQDDILDQECMQRLLKIQTELIDFDSMPHNDTFGLETELCHEISQQEQENMIVLPEGDSEDSYLKGIQAELMEEGSLGDLLLTGAEAVEAQNWALASEVIQRLNNLLSNTEKGGSTISFNRLVLFFTQGLHCRILNAPQVQYEYHVSSKETNTMSAFQMLQELSPYLKFAQFTANQAILEALQDDDQEVHVIDFDIMEGIQWPPLMVDLAMRRDASLRVTAITRDQQSASIVHQTGRRLKEFADSIYFPFTFDQIMVIREEDFEGIEMGQNHILVVNCMIHQYMPNRSFSLAKTFLGGIRKLSPRLVVLVEEELFNFARIKFMSFVEYFCEALHHYTAISDSLAFSFLGEYRMELPLIEKEFLGNRILDSVKQFPCDKVQRMVWDEGFSSLKGFKPVPLSFRNISQAKFLVSLFGGGYWVQYENYRLALCWKSRPLTVASIWVPTTCQHS